MTDSHAAAFQRHVATIALAACREQGFALAGGQALIAHGIVNRATEDIDIFTNDPAGVRRASETVTVPPLRSYRISTAADAAMTWTFRSASPIGSSPSMTTAVEVLLHDRQPLPARWTEHRPHTPLGCVAIWGRPASSSTRPWPSRPATDAFATEIGNGPR